LIALRAFGSIGLYSFVAIRRRQRGQITIGCFGCGPMPEKTTIKRICQSGEIAEAKITPQQGVYLVAAAELGMRSTCSRTPAWLMDALPGHRPDVRGSDRQAWPAAGTVRSDDCPRSERSVLI
jgi:hypothetical protein